MASDGEARNNITGGVRTAAAIVIVRRLSLFSAASVLRPATTITGFCNGRYRRASANKTNDCTGCKCNFAMQPEVPYSSLNNVQDAP